MKSDYSLVSSMVSDHELEVEGRWSLATVMGLEGATENERLFMTLGKEFSPT